MRNSEPGNPPPYDAVVEPPPRYLSPPPYTSLLLPAGPVSVVRPADLAAHAIGQQSIPKYLNLCNILKALRERCTARIFCPIITFTVLFFMSSLPITALVMGTGTHWICPGQPRVFIWLTVFGVAGIIVCCLMVFLIIWHIVCYEWGETWRNRLWIIIILLCFGFVIVMFFLGSIWAISGGSDGTIQYTDREKKSYCDSVVWNFTMRMCLFQAFFIIGTVVFAGCSALFLKA